MSEPGSLIRTLSGRQTARNFHSYVINEVGRAIVTGTMPVGSSLPGDAEMMARYDVSRTVLREAIKTLRQLDDRTLRDIGISRCQIETAVAGNFDLELVRIR